MTAKRPAKARRDVVIASFGGRVAVCLRGARRRLIASGQVYVRPGNVDSPYAAPGPLYYEPRHVPPGPAYVPGYVPPGQVYRAPAFYGATRSVYPAQSAYVNRQSEYSSTYVAEFPLRPPASVPYVGGPLNVSSRGHSRPIANIAFL